MSKEQAPKHYLDILYNTIKSRKGGNIEKSYTAQLFEKGVKKIAQKIGEESTEVIVAALQETQAQVVSESADLLYHLMVLWVERGILPEDVFKELEGRAGISGFEEKNLRKTK
jgi:phosphoribosyl-ATP pyrophosphohydrolase